MQGLVFRVQGSELCRVYGLDLVSLLSNGGHGAMRLRAYGKLL